MYPELLSVEQAAQRLAVHPRTLLRHIRSGRLRATRIGKAYRITGADLDAFTGTPRAAPPPHPQVTTIVDLPACPAPAAAALTTALHARLASRTTQAPALRLDTAYSPEQQVLKLILIGGLDDTHALLGSVQLLLAHGPQA
ncbi:helix-turn-helix domain-containing protein [Stenotrophomonas sp. 24(2023)]|uniref:helix-turn-helix domain-containing protein n=1 Tax=Stenotrophomonas sp. 24(2023) TaxID=3068324 RepID=UPI0027DFDAE7|nr:helix-turn-helix domain-containing protein [Stenotrophomonas sp. 24(2023)]WMJ68926.1 helix-turn-helix domain-containing protein [Stenotrophomonas sp. 24(2023)]